MRIGIALATLVAAALAGFAIYTFGWHERGEPRARADPSIRTVKDVAGVHRVITLRDGDIVRRTEAATECMASGEGGRPNLFCTRIENGRHEVIFYEDRVLVWPLDCAGCGPDGPVYDYLWTPFVVRASGTSQRLGQLEQDARKRQVTYADAIHSFGKPTSCRTLGTPASARADWRVIGLRLKLATLGGLPRGKDGCSAPGAIYIASAYVSGRRWQTPKGLRVGLPVSTIRALYPHAVFQSRPRGDWPGPAYWIVHASRPCIGSCPSPSVTVPRLSALVKDGRVAGFFFPVGAQGE
jgi:hypothetical protein